jgi:hypothetical protein
MNRIIIVLFLLLITNRLCAQVYLGISTGTYTGNLSIGGAGIGYKIGKFSPNINFTFNAYLDRGRIKGQSQNLNDVEFVPQIGFDYSLLSKTVELFIPFQIGTFFWELPSTLNYSFFTELGIGAQKRFDEIEIGGNVGLYYRIVNYDQDTNYQFSNHHLSQYVKLQIKYYFGKKNN